MCIYIFCDNNLRDHVKWHLDGKDLGLCSRKLKVQTPFWTCFVHDIIMTTSYFKFVEPKQKKCFCQHWSQYHLNTNHIHPFRPMPFHYCFQKYS